MKSIKNPLNTKHEQKSFSNPFFGNLATMNTLFIIQ